MLKRPHYIALGVVVLIALTILNLRSHTATRLKLAIGSLFLPLFGLATSSHQLAEKTAGAVASRSELQRENETLRRENQDLRLRLTQAEEEAREAARLRQLFGWQQKEPWKLKLARVVTRDPANWWRTVQIDAGSREGIRANLPVLTTEGLVGRVSSVSLTHAQVVLLGDPNCKASAMVENQPGGSGDQGMLAAAGLFDGSLVEMDFFKVVNVKAGQNVVTSGVGGIFPKGIPVGKIADSRQADYGLYTEARIKLAADLNSLEEVWVLMQ